MLAACGPREATSECNLALNAAALTGATDSAELLKLPADRLGALSQLHPNGVSGPRICTATLIRDGWALTAAHCQREQTPSLFIRPRGGPEIELIAEEIQTHPDADLMLAKVDARAVREAGVRPLPLNGSALDAQRVGEPVQLAGYGSSSVAGTGSGELRFVVEELSAVGSTKLSVDGKGVSGACGGDSGGPLLLRRADGRTSVAGVLSVGSADCVGVDQYTRVDPWIDWIEGIAGPEVTQDDCDGVSVDGGCHHGMAVWCQDGALNSEVCTEAAPCGWSAPTGGYRCVATGSDPCEQVDGLGQCQGDRAAVCLHGQLAVVECEDCGEICQRSPANGRVHCTTAEAVSR